MPTYWPATRYGGTIRSSRGLCAALSDAGVELEVATTNVDGPGVLEVPTDRPSTVDGVRVHYCQCGLGRRIYRSPAMGDVIARVLPHTDLVHIHTVFLWPGLSAARLADKADKPYIVSPRGMLVPELIEAKSASIKRAWISLFERRTLAGAAAIHSTSQAESEGLRSLGLDLAPIEEIANGVEMPPEGLSTQAIENAWSEIPPGRRLLFLGRINWKKGLDLLLDCLPHLPTAALQIAGNDEEMLVPRLRQQALTHGVHDRIRWLGPVEGERKWALLAGADILIVPSLSENFGIVVAEGLAAGTTVVCTEGVGARNLVEKIAPECVVPREVTILSRRIGELLEAPDRREYIAREGRSLVREAYGWPAIAHQMIELYGRTAAGRGDQHA